jgi:hypothetical protein
VQRFSPGEPTYLPIVSKKASVVKLAAQQRTVPFINNPTMDTGCHAHCLPFFSVEGCFGARKFDMKIFLSFRQAKTGQLDKH